MSLRFYTLIGLALSQATSIAGSLDGTWINADSVTRSIPRIEISSPTDDRTELVKWNQTLPKHTKSSPVNLVMLGDSVEDRSPDKYGYATIDLKFADQVIIAKRSESQLVLEIITIFKDNSKRANYVENLVFNKIEAISEYGVPVKGNPDLVISPFSPGSRPLSVKGLTKDTKILDPNSGKSFRVP